jgi:penicillin-binding protein-related factor A (putative recombinase)
MTSKKVKNRSAFRCEICEDGRISFISRLNQNDFLSFFFCHTFMQMSQFLLDEKSSSLPIHHPIQSLINKSSSAYQWE